MGEVWGSWKMQNQDKRDRDGGSRQLQALVQERRHHAFGVLKRRKEVIVIICHYSSRPLLVRGSNSPTPLLVRGSNSPTPLLIMGPTHRCVAGLGDELHDAAVVRVLVACGSGHG